MSAQQINPQHHTDASRSDWLQVLDFGVPAVIPQANQESTVSAPSGFIAMP